MIEKKPGKTKHTSTDQESIIDLVKHKWQHFSNWVWQSSVPDEPQYLKVLRGLCRIIFIVIRESQDDRITLRASALTFTVVLSLVPMLALGTAVLKGLGAGDQMREAAYSLIEQFDPEASEAAPMLDQMPVPDKNENGSSTPIESNKEVVGDTGKKQTSSLTSHLRKAVDQLFDYVDRTDFTTLGTFGILGMVLAALGVLGSIEQSMNAIWQTDTGRALGRKIIDYMALMILLPISVNLALATAATLQSPDLLSKIQTVMPFGMDKFFLKILPILILVLTFSLLYRFIPNTRVGFIPAIAGGFFGGICWFWVQIFYVKLQIGVAKYNAIYGSFATLPLFFLWIYVAWVIFLLGAEVAFALQFWKHYQWKKIVLSPVIRLAMAFDIMEAALNDFTARKVTTKNTLARQLDQPINAIAVIIDELVKGGMLRRVIGKLEGYVPSAPSSSLKPIEIVDIVFGKDKDIPEVLKGCGLANQALQAVRQTLDKKVIDCHQTGGVLPSEKSQ
jgi:membrane protein